jgi:uncharacterized protein (TIGR04255 family)
MSKPELPHKPLVEAIFEVKWDLAKPTTGQIESKLISDYKLLPGRLYDLLKDKYTYHELVFPAELPSELMPYQPQHRFRSGENAWPLVQLGLGVLTVNDTEGYLWRPFKSYCDEALTALHTIQGESGRSSYNLLALRYIDAIRIESNDPQDPIAFCSQLLHLPIAIPQDLFLPGITETPNALKLQFSLPCTSPVGNASVALSTGRLKSDLAIILETLVKSEGDQTRSVDIGGWLEQAHDVLSDWFVALTAGELHRRFSDGLDVKQ